MKSGIAALLLLVACGARPGAYACDASPFAFTADYAPNCTTVRADVELTRSILDARGIVRAADFDSVFAGVPVLVTDLVDLGSNGGDGVDGRYDSAGITLSYNASAFLHECLHHVDGPLTHWHQDWAARGWYAADDEYASRQQSPSFGPDGRPVTIPREP